MNTALNNALSAEDGMVIYDYIVNNAEFGVKDMEQLVDRLVEIDSTGQFLASTARFLNAVNKEAYAPYVHTLIKGAIERDKERRYIGSLLEAIWGADFKDHVEELKEDDNFRRIYKRIYEHF